MPGEPLRADYLGTRRARRYKLRPGFEVRVDGNPTTLVDLSGTGARLVGSTVLRLKQRVTSRDGNGAGGRSLFRVCRLGCV